MAVPEDYGMVAYRRMPMTMPTSLEQPNSVADT